LLQQFEIVTRLYYTHEGLNLSRNYMTTHHSPQVAIRCGKVKRKERRRIVGLYSPSYITIMLLLY